MRRKFKRYGSYPMSPSMLKPGVVFNPSKARFQERLKRILRALESQHDRQEQITDPENGESSTRFKSGVIEDKGEIT